MRFTSYSNSSTVVSLPSVSPGTSVSEGGTFVVDVEVDPPPGGLASDLTVTLAITDGTTSKTMQNVMLGDMPPYMTIILSVAPADYALSPANGEVVFPAGTVATTIMTVTITTTSDTIMEDDEDFTVEIASTNPISTMGIPSTQTLTVLNDDGEFFLYQWYTLFIIS